MTKAEHTALIEAYEGDPWKVRAALKKIIDTAQITEEPKGNWTGNQRNASWLYITHKVQQLNEAGLDIRAVLKPTYNIPWTKENFHDHVWVPLQKAMYGTSSMRDLKKDQPGKIHEVIERELGEKHGLDYIPFPSEEKKSELLEGMRVDIRNQDSYPDAEDTEVRF